VEHLGAYTIRVQNASVDKSINFSIKIYKVLSANRHYTRAYSHVIKRIVDSFPYIIEYIIEFVVQNDIRLG
jgi:hypothetical protein